MDSPPVPLPAKWMIKTSVFQNKRNTQENKENKTKSPFEIENTECLIPTEFAKTTFGEVSTLNHKVFDDSVEGGSFEMKGFPGGFTRAFFSWKRQKKVFVGIERLKRTHSKSQC